MPQTTDDQIASFDGIDQVVAEPLRLKVKLAIGEDAYAALRIRRTVQELWDVGGVAATGGAVAASPAVAATFFAGSGWLSALGLGAAATTPVGWIIGAAVLSGGAYYGVLRLFRTYSASRVQVIPAFLSTPMDVLGASLFDMIGPLGLKIAAFGGDLDDTERHCLARYFVNEWGLDPGYVARALPVVEQNSAAQSLKSLATELARFCRGNPDCNYAAMQTDLLAFLREISLADGRMDEREELGIESVERILRDEGRFRPFRRTAGWIRDHLPTRRRSGNRPDR